jgi:carbon monoxide dehydrogenase subunit G
MLKKILLFLAALILIFIVVVAMQPSEFQMERSTAIKAPPAAVFAQVNDLKKWDAWSPWKDLDPNAKIGFEGPAEGQGAIMTWSGNSQVGEGKLTLTESKPNELIKIKVEMVKPMEGSSTADFTFKPEGDKTAVTWSTAAHHNFVEKALCLIMNGKKMMSEMMDKGLAQMKQVAEQQG